MCEMRRKDSPRDTWREINLLVSEVSEKVIRRLRRFHRSERTSSHEKAQEAQRKSPNSCVLLFEPFVPLCDLIVYLRNCEMCGLFSYKFPKTKSVIIWYQCLTSTGSVTPWRDFG